MILELLVADPAIKVVVEGLHQLEDLLLLNREAHALQHIVELINLDVVITIVVDLLEYLLQGHASLLQDFDQVVEDLVLHAAVLPFLLDSFNFERVVTPVELIKLLELDDSVLVGIDLLEEGSHFVGFQAQVEVLTKIDLEVSKSKEPIVVSVKSDKRFLDIHRVCKPLLHRFEHPVRMHFLVELTLHFLVCSVDVMTCH